MKLLVMSDSHGNRLALTKIHEVWEGKVDSFIHCGDSEFSHDDPQLRKFTTVGGNMDFDPGYEQDRVLKAGNYTIFITHGHRYGINYSFDRLEKKAEEVGADIVLYGHLHAISCKKKANKLFINPGSVQQPRGEIHIKAYAILDLSEEKIEVQYYSMDHKPLQELYFQYQTT